MAVIRGRELQENATRTSEEQKKKQDKEESEEKAKEKTKSELDKVAEEIERKLTVNTENSKTVKENEK